MTEKLVQLDPVGCGCTECLIGLYKPLDSASHAEVRAMLDGALGNATSEKFRYADGKIVAKYSGLEWQPSASEPPTGGLFEMRVQHPDGTIIPLYGHTTANVIDQYWQVYAGRGCTVMIRPVEVCASCGSNPPLHQRRSSGGVPQLLGE